jgi:hypothetical protein
LEIVELKKNPVAQIESIDWKENFSQKEDLQERNLCVLCYLLL